MPPTWSKLGEAVLDVLFGTDSSTAAPYKLDPKVAPYFGTKYSPTNSTGPIDPSNQIEDCQKPFVYIATEPMETPMPMHSREWAILYQKDMHDDSKIIELLGGDETLKDITKGAITLLARGHAKWITAAAKAQGVDPCDIKIMKPRISEKKIISEHEKKQATGKNKKSEIGRNNRLANAPPKTRNPLNSPSVEDFFADHNENETFASFKEDSKAKVYVGPDYISIDQISLKELVVVFHRISKQLYVRKIDGELYPVVWSMCSQPPALVHEKKQENRCQKRGLAIFKEVFVDEDEDSWMDVELSSG